MKKVIKIIILIVVLIVVSMGSVIADDQNENGNENGIDDVKEQYEKLLEESGALELEYEIPDESKVLLSDNDISVSDTDALLELSIFDFIGSIFTTIKTSLTKPTAILMTSIGIILLCALLNSVKSGFRNSSYEKAFSVVSVICIAGTIIMPIADIITRASGVIKQVSNFMLSFVPVYVGIISATGKPISAVTYQLSLVSVVQIISRIASTVLIPLLAIYLAFCLIGSTSSQINIGGISKGVKTVVTVTLGFLLTIFVGLLTIQGVVSNSADTLTLKTAKFAISTFLPVVGSAVSEALNTVQGCMGVIKSTVGGFSIIVIVASFLPSIITIILMQLALQISASIGDMLETDKISTLMRSASSVMSILLGIMVVFFVLLTVSIGIMLTLGN